MAKSFRAAWSSQMNEREFLERLRTRAQAIGDDCAVIPNGKRDLLFTTDLMVENVHFLRSYPADVIGRKTIIRCLSDIAAMGGDPRYCLLSVAFAPWAAGKWLDKFFDGA